MKAEAIFKDVNLILRQMTDFPEVLEEHLTDTELQEMDALVIRLGNDIEASGEGGQLLLEVAHEFLTEIENTPAFLNLFCPDASKADINALLEERKLPLNQPITDKNFTKWKGILINSVREYSYQTENKKKVSDDEHKKKNS